MAAEQEEAAITKRSPVAWHGRSPCQILTVARRLSFVSHALSSFLGCGATLLTLSSPKETHQRDSTPASCDPNASLSILYAFFLLVAQNRSVTPSSGTTIMDPNNQTVRRLHKRTTNLEGGIAALLFAPRTHTQHSDPTTQSNHKHTLCFTDDDR